MPHVIYGGKVENIPTPHIRRYTNEGGAGTQEDPRRVTVKIDSWVGISLGAKHVYLEIKEDDNPIWDSTEECWRAPWSDPEKSARRIPKMSLLNEDEAIAIAHTIINTCYRHPGWEIVWKTEDQILKRVRAYKALIRDNTGG